MASLARTTRLALAPLFPALLMSAGGASGSPHSPRHVVELTMTAAPARLSLIPGHMTDVFAYNGQVPGPTLQFHEGDHVVIHFHNKLPESSTIHWHGFHLPANMDGSPLDSVPAGGSYDYVFDVPRGTAGTYWYHPHPDRRTGEEVARGLYGAIIVRSHDDPLAGIPEQLVLLSDNRFRPDGSIDLPDINSMQGQIDLENGREGNVIFVNGKIMPSIKIRNGEVQLWRIVNASGARMYRLSLPGHEFIQVGTDGGWIENPVPMQEVLLAPAERAEVLVRATGAPGTRAVLEDLPYDRYVQQTRPADWNTTRHVLTLQYTNDAPVKPVAIPAHLRVVPRLDTNAATVRRTIVFGQGMINDKQMDLHRVDEYAKLGATEIWTIENVVGMDHPFHLHGFQFQVLSRNGVPEPYPAWRDMVNVPKHEAVRIIVRFSDFPGKWMYHCHILDHEDEGMMGILQVSPTGR